VVLVFLQTWRASIIPLLALPVSLVGTFSIMLLLGFSLNTCRCSAWFSRLALVVDDAIVVVENVNEISSWATKPHEATRRAMQESAAPSWAIALVLSAVFIPLHSSSALGQFYKQFALTIAISTIISAFNSLTLSPALAALLLKPHGAKKDRFHARNRFCVWLVLHLFNRFFGPRIQRLRKTRHTHIAFKRHRSCGLTPASNWLDHFRFLARANGFRPHPGQGLISFRLHSCQTAQLSIVPKDVMLCYASKTTGQESSPRTLADITEIPATCSEPYTSPVVPDSALRRSTQIHGWIHRTKHCPSLRNRLSPNLAKPIHPENGESREPSWLRTRHSAPEPILEYNLRQYHSRALQPPSGPTAVPRQAFIDYSSPVRQNSISEPLA